MFRAFWLCLCVSCNGGAPETVTPEPAAEQPEVVEEAPPAAPEVRQIAEIPRPRIRARHILIAHTEAKRAPVGVERTRAAAELLAEQVRGKLEAGEDFESLAKDFSDDGSKKRGGDLGVFTKGVMNPAFEEATLALEVGGRSAVIETPFGFHIIERLEVIELALAHILVQWKGLKKARSDRSRAEAQTRADQALALIEAGQPFEEVAKEWSDGPFGKRGGDLGWFQQGQMAPQFDEAAFALAPGAHTEVVESTHGFHIIKRIK
jgi:NIMA-interacting peptidyl-prolyl cis-trans isomerase 1